MLLALLPLLATGAATPAAPAVSPSIEADAEYLLTTTDFMSAQFGMNIEAVTEGGGRLTVRTTGAEFGFEPTAGLLRLNQRLGKPREAARVTFPTGTLEGLKVERKGTGAVLLSAAGGKLQMRLNADSLLMLRSAEPLTVSYQVTFTPGTMRQFGGNSLILDEWGGIGSYVVTGTSGPPLQPDAAGATGPVAKHELKAGQILWLGVAPPKPYDWRASFRDRVVWHWSKQTGYPSDAEIEQWSKYGNLLLQQSEVMLWKDWSLRFIPRDGLEEFQRVNRTCARCGIRNFVYTSPFYFLTGTGLESKAMNSFDHFEETGFSPGDGRGLNWPIFLEEITKVMREYQPGGLYFDGIYDNVVRTYLIARKAREVVGEGGILEYHATGSPPGGGVYLPQIDTYFNFVLRGEGAQGAYQSEDYLRYFVSTYNISNAIGVLCNNNDYQLDEAFIGRLLDNNVRLHLIPGWLTDYRKDVMEKLYWPALSEGLQARVAAASDRRQQAMSRQLVALREAQRTGTADLELIYEAPLTDPQLAVRGPAAPAGGTPQTQPPADPKYLDLPGGWRAYFSPNSEGALAVEEGALKITARSNGCAYLERALPDETVAVQCKLRCGPEGGMSWGPGLLLRVGDAYWRINARADDRLGMDRGEGQLLADGFPLGAWYWVRLRLVGEFLLYEASTDGTHWRCLQTDSVGALTGPKRLLIGKVANNGTNVEYPELGGMGTSYVAEVRAFGTGGGGGARP